VESKSFTCVNGPNKVHKKGFDIDLGKD